MRANDGQDFPPSDMAPVWSCVMDRAMLRDRLAAAERHVAEVERHIANQRELVAQLERDGRDTAHAKQLLEQFEEVLAIHVAERERLRAELGL